MKKTPTWFYGKAIDSHELVMWVGETSLVTSWLPLGFLLGDRQGDVPPLPARLPSEPSCHEGQRKCLGDPGVYRTNPSAVPAFP